MRVLQIVQNLNYGGMERLVSDLVVSLDPDGFECHVLCLNYLGHFSGKLHAHASLHLAGRFYPGSVIWPRSLTRQIRAIAPDVVHTHGGVWYKASLAARLAGVPRLVHTEHGPKIGQSAFARLQDRRAALRTDCVVAVSEALAAGLIERRIVDPSRLRVIRNGIDTRHEHDEAARLRERLGIPVGAVVIGSVGRLEPVKGYDVMLRAFSLTGSDRDPEPWLVLAGAGSEEARLRELAETLGIEGRVCMLGWRDDVDALHGAFDVFALSSHSEGTSVSLLEAMSAGLPVVVTDVGGNADVLGPDLGHRLAECASPESLAETWRPLLRDAQLRQREGEKARNRAQTTFSLDGMVRAYEALYTEIPRHPDANPPPSEPLAPVTDGARVRT